MSRAIDTLVVHHSAGPNTQSAAAIRRFHMRPKSQGGRGWRDVAYHYLIEGDGSVVVGRPFTHVGSHAKGANATSIGVCVIGDNTRGNGFAWTAHQKQSLRRFVRAFRLLFPGARVVGHRDSGGVTRTECPGVEIAAMLPEG